MREKSGFIFTKAALTIWRMGAQRMALGDGIFELAEREQAPGEGVSSAPALDFR